MPRATDQLDTENLSEPHPEHLSRTLKELITPAENIIISVSTDLTLMGNYGRDWLIATDQQLVIINANASNLPKITQVLLPEVESVETIKFFGNDVLRLRLGDRTVEAARYSKSLTHKFEKAMSVLQGLAEPNRLNFNTEAVSGKCNSIGSTDKDLKRCEKCGDIIADTASICPNCTEKRYEGLLRLLNHVQPYWHIIVLSLLLVLAINIIAIVPDILTGKVLIDRILAPAPQVIEQPRVIDKIIDSMIVREDNPDLKWLLIKVCIVLGVIYITTSGLRTLRSYMTAWLGQRVTCNLRNEAYAHLHELSLDFYTSRDTGSIVSRLTSDMERLKDFLAEGLQEIIHNTLMLIVMGVVMFYLNWQLALFAIIPLPLTLLATSMFGKRLNRLFPVLWRRCEDLSVILTSVIPGVRVVKAFTQEKRETVRFHNCSNEVFRTEVHVAKLWTTFESTTRFFGLIGGLIIWFVAGSRVLAGGITLGDLMVFISFMTRFLGPARMFSHWFQRMQRASTIAGHIFEILDRQPDITDRSDAIKLEHLHGSIEFRNVSFSYDGQKKALDNINFYIKPGEMIGLAGHSGAGKSTLLNLLCRFYDVNEGAILVDGIDIRNMQKHWLRSQIAVVFQNPFLFNGTVAENIAYGSPDATMAEILSAAKIANVHDFVMKFPEGYDTVVGERGVRVSGGERQRVSIARAILKNPRILLLDEATSSVDTKTESLVQESLERLIQGRTVFAIAHRLSTLKHADRLLILKEGGLDEVGTHAELLEKNGTFARLCELQTELTRIRAW